MLQLLNRFWKREDGATAVEFALIAVGFLTLVFGIFESGRLFMTWNAFQYSLEDTTRRALISENITEVELEQTIIDNMGDVMLDPNNVTLDISFTDYSGVNILEVNGTYTFSPVLLAFLPDSWTTINLYAQSRLPMSWQ